MPSFSRGQIDLIAERARALGDGTRVRILTVLGKREQAVGQIADAAGTQQSTVSKHLQVLFHAGLVQRRRDAAAVIYSLTSADVLKLLEYLGRRRMDKAIRARTGTRHGAASVASGTNRRRR